MTTKLEKLIHKDQVAVLDSGFTLIGIVPWERAVMLLVSEEASTIVERSDGSAIRSLYLTIPKPVVIILRKYVGSKSRQFKLDETVSKSAVLARDDYTCWICGEPGHTVDHLLPRSRGGLSTYGNLAAACKRCNQRKKNLTPKEIDREWPHIPKVIVSKRKVAIEEAIYEALAVLSE